MHEDEVHFEPYLHLAGLTDCRALLSWGGFFFRRDGRDGWMVIDDERLDGVHTGRRESIGERSRSYGPAQVEVFDESGSRVARASAADRNHVWIEGLEPDTRYRYEVHVEGEPWLKGERYDWVADEHGQHGLRRSGRQYDCSFRTHPSPQQRADLAFGAIGDFGVGIRSERDDALRQRRIAQALERAVDAFDARLILTLGDNIYLDPEHTQASGKEDDDWFFTFYQPYRYLINRIPFYPTVGNHDSSDTENSDDRQQLNDNFFLGQRFVEGLEAERSVMEPGLFYSFRYGADIEFICIDTTCSGDRYFQRPKAVAFLREALCADTARTRWHIPFSHHPTYCAGPEHDNTDGMEEVLSPLFRQSGVQLALAGHEHNFQHSYADGIHYLVAGAGGKLRLDPPRDFAAAHTCDWISLEHFLIVQLQEQRAIVHPLTAADDGSFVPLVRTTPDGERRDQPIVIRRP